MVIVDLGCSVGPFRDEVTKGVRCRRNLLIFHFRSFLAAVRRAEGHHASPYSKRVTKRVTQVTKRETFHFFFGADDPGSTRRGHIKPSTMYGCTKRVRWRTNRVLSMYGVIKRVT